MTLKLLIVDDSRMSRLLLQSMVQQQHPDWILTHAGTGEEALALAKTQPFDLVSMDFNMPGMNGYDAALALRALQPQAAIAILTANVQSAVRDRATDAGLTFLTKPITATTVRELARLAGA